MKGVINFLGIYVFCSPIVGVIYVLCANYYSLENFLIWNLFASIGIILYSVFHNSESQPEVNEVIYPYYHREDEEYVDFNENATEICDTCKGEYSASYVTTSLQGAICEKCKKKQDAEASMLEIAKKNGFNSTEEYIRSIF